ncbi:peroxisomal ATPase PEX6 isoform X2 [Physcomitrium patens]|uniref:Peroxisomal ATPase PEX6 n=1 Tax=Physcomitrium patens TaxID=3218 RepID=A0A7I4BAG3_PHYPA|nr:peroxisome biogenesis protein 6-like isoform X2 [Physcomitrium patens]|eukprot:XP_024401035.1 peroxisome biogenesis protein 6-like isoform X2 [Physcomitrella patens]
MARGRKPLVLQETAEAVLAGLEEKERPGSVQRRVPQARAERLSSRVPERFKPGLLFFPSDCMRGMPENNSMKKDANSPWDEASMLGLSVSALRNLTLSSGSWVLVRNLITNVARPARVIVLDPPEMQSASKSDLDNGSVNLHKASEKSTFFPSFTVSEKIETVNHQVAYLSYPLAFNIGLHVAWLDMLIRKGSSDDKDVESTHPYSGDYLLGNSSTLELYPFHVYIGGKVPKSLAHQAVHKVSNGVFHYAAHMRIAHIRTPASAANFSKEKDYLAALKKDRQERIDTALTNYFEVDRLVAIGDILSIRIPSPDPSFHASFGDVYSMQEELIHFKVLGLEPPSGRSSLVNRHKTALVLGGAEPSELPPPVLGFSKWMSSRQPVCLSSPEISAPPEVQKLKSLFAPCIHPQASRLSLRTAVILHGPTGIGKRTIVKMAAEELGLHVVDVNCFDLLGATENKTATAIADAFETARRYAPAVLLLRRFGALSKSLSGGGQDQPKSISLIGAALREGIHAHLEHNQEENFGSACDDQNSLSTSDLSMDTLSENEDEGLGATKFEVDSKGPTPGLVLLVGALESKEDLKPALRRSFTHTIEVEGPDESRRLTLLHHFLGLTQETASLSTALPQISEQKDEKLMSLIKSVASQTSGSTPRDLRALAVDARANAVCRLLKSSKENKNHSNLTIENGDHGEDDSSSQLDGTIADEINDHREVNHHSDVIVAPIESEDMQEAFDRLKKRTASAIGTPKIPNVKWEDVGGLEDVKKAILDTVQLPLMHRELFASGLRKRSGVLLYGPPGTGKTLLAKAVATECALNFLSVKGPELINMYIGESEKNVRDIFQKARAARPCVVFFDELDALAPARGAAGDSGGVMDRVVSQMLAEIDGISDNGQDLFMIGASNRPDLIDPALLRPGRFDKLLYVGVSTESTHRLRVLEALTRKFKLDKYVSLPTIARRCPVNFTGADLYALCADAWMNGAKRKVEDDQEAIDNGYEVNEDDTVVVKQDDFLKALQEITPSLSLLELERYERIRQQYEGGSKSR